MERAVNELRASWLLEQEVEGLGHGTPAEVMKTKQGRCPGMWSRQPQVKVLPQMPSYAGRQAGAGNRARASEWAPAWGQALQVARRCLHFWLMRSRTPHPETKRMPASWQPGQLPTFMPGVLIRYRFLSGWSERPSDSCTHVPKMYTRSVEAHVDARAGNMQDA